jgi:hypothetical protein
MLGPICLLLEDAARFIAWLRLPPPARSGKVSVLPSGRSLLLADERESEARRGVVILRV